MSPPRTEATDPGPDGRGGRGLGTRGRHPSKLVGAVAATLIVLVGCSHNTGTPAVSAATFNATATPTATTATATPTAITAATAERSLISTGTATSTHPPTLTTHPTGTATHSTEQSSAAATTSSGGSGRAAYVAAADAVCARASQELAAVPPPIGTQDLVATLTGQLAVQSETLNALQGISSPSADRSQIMQRLLNPFRDAIAQERTLLPTVQAAISSGDHVQLATLHTHYDEAGHPPAIAAFVRDFGLHSCQSFEYFRSR